MGMRYTKSLLEMPGRDKELLMRNDTSRKGKLVEGVRCMCRFGMRYTRWQSWIEMPGRDKELLMALQGKEDS